MDNNKKDFIEKEIGENSKTKIKAANNEKKKRDQSECTLEKSGDANLIANKNGPKKERIFDPREPKRIKKEKELYSYDFYKHYLEKALFNITLPTLSQHGNQIKKNNTNIILENLNLFQKSKLNNKLILDKIKCINNKNNINNINQLINNHNTIEGLTFIEPRAFVQENEIEKKVYIEIEIPGVDRDGIKMNLENSVLTVTAKKKSNYDRFEAGGESMCPFQRHHKSFGLYKIIFLINLNNIYRDSMKARIVDGILLITIDKSNNLPTLKIVRNLTN